MRVLLVEDDERLANALVKILQDASYDVDWVKDGQSGLDYGESDYYDVIILDWMLPIMNGVEVAKELRRQGSATPIIMLTAKAATADKVAGLDAGADDYLVKPFAPAELLARLRALGRRQGEVLFEALNAGDLILNLDSCDLSCGDESIHLRMKEFIIMKMLMSNPGRVVSRDAILEEGWGMEASTSSNIVEAHISFIRKKLRYLNSQVSIESVPKVGYRLLEDGEQ